MPHRFNQGLSGNLVNFAKAYFKISNQIDSAIATIITIEEYYITKSIIFIFLIIPYTLLNSDINIGLTNTEKTLLQVSKDI